MNWSYLQAGSVTAAVVVSLAVAITSPGPASAATCSFSAGAGSAEDPWQVATAADLSCLQSDETYWAADMHFVQTTDIDMANATWSHGIGTGQTFAAFTFFAGTYNGGGHVISNLTVDSTLSPSAGLFGAVDATGVVRNVGFSGSVTRSWIGWPWPTVGGLVGYNKGTVSNSFATGSATVTDATDSLGLVGGLVGYNDTGSVSNSYATGSVSAKYSYAGGLVGYNKGTVTDSYAVGAVTNPGGQTGGLVGRNETNSPVGTVSGSYWNTETAAVGISDGDTTGATGLTTSQMKVSATFTTWSMADGWSASRTWGICESVSYPFLTSFYGSAPCASTAPGFTASDPPDTGTVGTAYEEYTFAASGSPAPVFAVSSGALPDGLSLASDGALSGTPSKAGVFTFRVTATNGVDPDAVTSDITITIAGTCTVSPTPEDWRALALAAAEEGSRVDWSYCDLSGQDLSDLNLGYGKLAGASLTGADLTASNLAWATLTGADLSGATLGAANLEYAKLAGASLAGADLADSYLAWANLTRADLSGAHLAGSRFINADLTEADLSDVTLTCRAPGSPGTGCAELIQSDLSSADLTDADLTGAELSGAILTGANLTRAKLVDVRLGSYGFPRADDATWTDAIIAGWVIQYYWFCGTEDLFDGALGTLLAPSPATWAWLESDGRSYLRVVVPCAVWFDRNGGTGSMAVQAASPGTGLSANTFTRDGYTFAGWNTNRDGSGTAYADRASYPFTAHTTLYAQWVAGSAPDPTPDPAPGPGPAPDRSLAPTAAPAPSPSPTPSTDPATQPVVNGETATPIAGSVSLVDAATAAETTDRYMRNAPSTTIGTAPKVAATVGDPVSLVLRSLTAGTVYTLKVKIGGAYTVVGTVTAGPTGQLFLPVMQFDAAGTYTVALVSPSGVVSYVKIVVS